MKQLLLISFIALTISASAQREEIVVEGIVISAEDFKQVQGVTIMIVGTNQGTISDERGRFRISFAPGSSLRFSHLSFEPKEVITTKVTVSQNMVVMLHAAPPNVLDTVVARKIDNSAFERNFRNLRVRDSLRSIAQGNISPEKRNMLLNSISADGREGYALQRKAAFERQRQTSQTQHIKLFDLVVWYKLFRKKKKP